jgi:formyl-CoA transferase
VRGHYLTAGNPIKLSASRTAITMAPLLGQHRHEILRELGYDEAAIKALVDEGTT